MNPSNQPPGTVLAYARAVTARLEGASDGLLRAAYLHGSAALGGWVPGHSDVDMLLVAENDIGAEAVDRLGQELHGSAAECPGRDLECSVVTVAQAERPGPPWPYLLHVVAGPGQPGKTVRPASEAQGDPDLLMHYAVCRAAGWPVRGPEAAELIGTVPRRDVLDYLAGELGWGIEHGPESYAVLNACRALIYLTRGKIVSKIAGGEAALGSAAGPTDVIQRALRQQRGAAPSQPPAPDAIAFVRAVAARLRSAHAEYR
jgi:Domain of unknown function (DUF4111)